jgi:hypothetical protein
LFEEIKDEEEDEEGVHVVKEEVGVGVIGEGVV